MELKEHQFLLVSRIAPKFQFRQKLHAWERKSFAVLHLGIILINSGRYMYLVYKVSGFICTFKGKYTYVLYDIH